MSADRLEMLVRIERLPYRAPFRISGHTFTESSAVFVTLVQGGLEGRGEAAGVYFLDDTPPRIAATLASLRATVEAGITRAELQELLPIGGARNALDCALWELEARRARQPVWRLAGIDRVRPLVTTFTLGAEAPSTMVAATRKLESAQALKLKLSGDPALDAERVLAVRSACPEIWLGVDANQGYTIESFAGLLPVLTRSRVELVEQPLARGRESELDGFDCPIELAADESVLGLADIAAAADRFDVVNIKLDKCGGLTEALLMEQEARRLGLKVMVGNMVGSSLAMAPAFVLAQRSDYVDLDGPTFLAHDPPPAVHYENGTIWCGPEVWGGPGKA